MKVSIRMGKNWAKLGRAIGDDVVGTYQPVAMYRRSEPKIRRVFMTAVWWLWCVLVLGVLEHTSYLTRAIKWVREAPAEEVSTGLLAVANLIVVLMLLVKVLAVFRRNESLVSINTGESGGRARGYVREAAPGVTADKPGRVTGRE
ncbi:hypothetical protein BI49514_02402 [Brevibacterium iodinum ATCC 49514]|uniref:Uncharacterized protein n=1 Tax=Brevibacterium iodinum ATCC 49514 TaxID=1255616 RepID=A0A2H1JV92_9MICO|nr:hypothetical protein [Brevibacterium iodinum]SMX91455.1 hypothetical protein BI49514_02402 [Brevibacterium iodinum ATCC 49514]SUW70164.1 Uncharacterised protein [Brevibacterium iodinum]